MSELSNQDFLDFAAMGSNNTNTPQRKADPASRIGQFFKGARQYPSQAGLSTSTLAPPAMSFESAFSQNFIPNLSGGNIFPTFGNANWDAFTSNHEEVHPSSTTYDGLAHMPSSIDHASNVPEHGVDSSSSESSSLEQLISPASIENSASSNLYLDPRMFTNSNTAYEGNHGTLDPLGVNNTPEKPRNLEVMAGYDFDVALKNLDSPDNFVGVSADVKDLEVFQADTTASNDLEHSGPAHQHSEDTLELQLVKNNTRAEHKSFTFSNHPDTPPKDAYSVVVEGTNENNDQKDSTPFSGQSDASSNDAGVVAELAMYDDNEEAFTPHPEQIEDGLAERPAVYRDMILEALETTGDAFDPPTQFASLEEAREHLRVKSRTQGFDHTIPQTVTQKIAIVKALNDLMWSVDRAQDNDGMKKPFRNNRHDPRRVELACWEVLEGAIKREKEGAFTTKQQKGTVGSFASRMAAIMESISCHKTICNHLLRDSYIHQLLDDPIGQRQRVISNQKLNKDKADLMKLGKEVRVKAKRQMKVIAPRQNSNRVMKATPSQQGRKQPQKVVNTNSSTGRYIAPAPAPDQAMNTAPHYPENHSSMLRYPIPYRRPQVPNYGGGQYSAAGTPLQAHRALVSPVYSIGPQSVNVGFEPNRSQEYYHFQNSPRVQSLGYGYAPRQLSPYPYSQGTGWVNAPESYMNMPGNVYNQPSAAANSPQALQLTGNSDRAKKKRARHDSEDDDVSGRSKRRR